MTITDDRPPARIFQGGVRLPLAGFEPAATLTYGHEEVLSQVPYLMAQPWLAVDIESEGLGVLMRRLKVVTVATTDHAVLFDPRDPMHHRALRDIFRVVPEIVCHYSPADVPPMAHMGLLGPDDAEKVTDTLIWARLADPDERGDRSLAMMARRYLGLEVEEGVTARAKRLGMTKSEYFLKIDLSSPAYRWDAASDGIATARLKDVVRRAALLRLTTGHPFTVYGVQGAEAERLVDREQIINRMMLARTIKGFRWDPEYLDEYRDARMADMGRWETELANYNIRPGVATDLTAFLERAGELPADWPRTPTGQLAGDKKNLEGLTHPLAQTFLAHKTTLKTDKDYLSKVADLADANGRIHPVCNILGAAATGRMSYGGPPLQQFDAEARGILLFDQGDSGVSIDWSQIEPVTAANIAGDTPVLSRYEDDSLPAKERDAYLGIAEYAGISRSQAKVVLLAQMYGEGLLKLATDLELISPAEAALIRIHADEHDCYQAEAAKALGIGGFQRAVAIRDMVFKAMPATARLIKKVKGIGQEHRIIFTLSGRILPIPMASYRGVWGPMTHKAVNYFVQGSAYDLLAEALIRIKEAGLGPAVYLAMHDELVVSRDAAHDVQKIMATPPERLIWMAGRTPVLRTDMADLGERWAKC